jgi:hypothetical protein
VKYIVCHIDAETLRVFGIAADVAMTLTPGSPDDALINGVKAQGVTDEQFTAASAQWTTALDAAAQSCGTAQ